jgi:hypothetical protein
VALENAFSYTHTCSKQLQGGWLLEKLLDQVSPLTNLRNRSARQAIEDQDFSGKPHRKRHFEEISTEEKDCDTKFPCDENRGLPFLQSLSLATLDRTLQFGMRQMPTISEDSRSIPPILPTHPSHEAININPTLKPYQVLAFTRDQQPLEMNFYSRSGKVVEANRQTNPDFLPFDSLPPKQGMSALFLSSDD